MIAAFALVLAVPFGRAFFDLVIPPLDIAAVIAVVAVVSAAVLHVVLRAIDHHEGRWVPWLGSDEEDE
jgi:hypothetical protein